MLCNLVKLLVNLFTQFLLTDCCRLILNGIVVGIMNFLLFHIILFYCYR